MKVDYNLYKTPGKVMDDKGVEFDLTHILCVNQKGDVFKYPRQHKDKFLAGGFAKARPTKTGHLQIGITDETGRKRYVYIHRLVGYAWLKNREPYHTDVLHNNDDPGNNHISNLRWGTPWDNIQDILLRGRAPKGQNRISNADLMRIYTMGIGRDNMKLRHIQAYYPKVSESVVWGVSKGKSSRLLNYYKHHPQEFTQLQKPI
jgi:hypothetical protein